MALIVHVILKKLFGNSPCFIYICFEQNKMQKNHLECLFYRKKFNLFLYLFFFVVVVLVCISPRTQKSFPLVRRKKFMLFDKNFPFFLFFYF